MTEATETRGGTDTAAETREILILMKESAVRWSADEAASWLARMRIEARVLHRLYEAACTRPLTDFEVARQERVENAVRAEFEAVGLVLELNTDPRGDPVAFLTPNTLAFNTMGGREAGWRI